MTARRLAALSLVVVLASVGGCAADDTEPSPSSTPAASSAAPVTADDALSRIADGASVIDVRTPEEFAAGHLEGATNIDVQADDFDDRVGALPPDEAYVVYCASGRRATGAVEQMRDLGFTDVVNGGGYDDLRARTTS